MKWESFILDDQQKLKFCFQTGHRKLSIRMLTQEEPRKYTHAHTHTSSLLKRVYLPSLPLPFTLETTFYYIYTLRSLQEEDRAM